MATTKEYHDYIVENLSVAGEIRTRKMMGEYLGYYREKLIGNICDNTLFLKQTDTSKKMLANCRLEYPYQGSKTLMYVAEEWENPDQLKTLLEGMYRELPPAKKR